MNVHQLRELLAGVDGEAEVVVETSFCTNNGPLPVQYVQHEAVKTYRPDGQTTRADGKFILLA